MVQRPETWSAKEENETHCFVIKQESITMAEIIVDNLPWDGLSGQEWRDFVAKANKVFKKKNKKIESLEQKVKELKKALGEKKAQSRRKKKQPNTHRRIYPG